MEYTNTDISMRIAELIHSERDRKILIRRLVDGITMERLAEEFDMSVGGIKLVVNRGKRILFSQT